MHIITAYRYPIVEVKYMSEIEDLIKDINKLKDNLNNLINNKNFDLQDSEVVAASKILNAAISEYNKLINEKIQTN
jgi:uncharacterized protein YdbL (DUF1318 family)